MKRLFRIFSRKKPIFSSITAGGQTGVEQAALDAALELGINCKGWCPAGRKSEKGTISGKYPVQEHASKEYVTRTDANVADAAGTLIFTYGSDSAGLDLITKSTRKHKKPLFVFDLLEDPSNTGLDKVYAWGEQNKVYDLNVTGPWESQAQGTYAVVKDIMLALLKMSLEKRQQ